MDLIEWATTYIKHRDIMRQQIASIETKDSIIHVKNKDKKVHDYFIEESLTNIKALLEAAKKSDKDQNYFIHIITKNTENNLNILIQRWQQFCIHERLTVYFVNQNSITEKKWIVKPWLHNKISDPDSLETGLKSLFSTVEEI
jgi:L-ribulose-5-phosphate 3-epimerase UlaE